MLETVLSLVISLSPAEDEPGWDCRTMGNHVCGPVVVCEPTVRDGQVYLDRCDWYRPGA